MMDGFELARRGFRHRLSSYLIMTVLVAFIISGYLVVASYWKDVSQVSVGTAEPMDFPYLKTTVVYAYYSNPPVSPDEEVPPPRKYVPLFNETELGRIEDLAGVTGLSVALSQESFSRYGNRELLSIEPQAPLWGDIDLVEGRLPENPKEILVPAELRKSGLEIGSRLTLKKPQTVLPRQYAQDPIIKTVQDPEPISSVAVVGVYEPRNTLISGYVGYLTVNRVDSYPERDPRSVEMDWPVPNTIFLGLEDPSKARSILAVWKSLYRDLPGTEISIIPPPKTSWMSDLPSVLMHEATGAMAAPVYANTFNAFALGAIGVFASMFTAFLDRRRELGIMKTVGIDGSKTSFTIALEVSFTGVLGTALGIVLALAITGTESGLKGITGNPITIPLSVMFLGMLVTGFLLVSATYIPRAMAKQGTVMELLQGRSIPIFRKTQT